MLDQRAHLLRASVGFALVSPTAPELRLLHRWLDSWSGVGYVVAGMARQEYRNCPCLCHVESLRLAHYNGHLVRRRGRIPGVSPRKKARAKQRG